ncbi:acetamidase/formamidase family protein [Halobacteria archaeon AArc-dxtr1]|nr:acetamidase/formamidase family protein [Halobacteria archaeon AArc-dxtr1]
MATDLVIDHHISATEGDCHTSWSRDHDPVRTVEPGDVVRFDCLDATGGQLDPDATVADVATVDTDRVHTLTGPVAVAGASPGDVLEVEILDIEHRGWGYTLVLPGAAELGLLADEFPEPALHIWDVEDGAAQFVDGIEVPAAPFPGTVGVAPEATGEFDTLPPRATGGNLDIKHLTVGSTVSLPVAVEGALFSTGDGHITQGDGEVCGTAIEAPMSITCRIDVRSDRSIDQPQFETEGPFTPTGRDEPMFATTGVDDDVREAARRAVREMIDHLQTERGLSREEAYILCSAAVDLKINQLANVPNWTVSAYLPREIFPAE